MDLKINRGKYKAMIATILAAYYFLYKGLLICFGCKIDNSGNIKQYLPHA